MDKIVLTGIVSSKSRVEQIRLLSVLTSKSLKDSRDLISLLEKGESVEIDFIEENVDNFRKLSDVGFVFIYPKSWYSRNFDEAETVEFLEREIVPYLNDYILEQFEADSFLLFNQKTSMVLIVESEAENLFMAKYLIDKGMKVIQKGNVPDKR